MHAIYVRGALLHTGRWTTRARAYLQQAGGAAGGWAASVRQHVPRRDAPLSHGLAWLVLRAGSLSGKVPRDVMPYLQTRPFRDFCDLNVQAERTAGEIAPA